MRPLVVAHRGASADAPELTRFAAEEAVAQGADSIELDLRLTADGIVVAVHDPDLERVAGDPRRVADVTSDELAEIDVGSWFNHANPDKARDAFRTARPLTLLEHLAWLRREAPDVGVHAELKDPADHGGRLEEAVVAALREHVDAGADPAGIVVESFDLDAVRRVAELDPGLRVGALWIEATPQVRDADFGLRVDVSGPSIWSVFAAPEHVVRAHERGIEVHVWTADDPEEVDGLLDLGVDAIVTNLPGGVRRLVDRHSSPGH